jgi:hypothetical protein
LAAIHPAVFGDSSLCQISSKQTTSGASRRSHSTISTRRAGQSGSSSEPAFNWAMRRTPVTAGD